MTKLNELKQKRKELDEEIERLENERPWPQDRDIYFTPDNGEHGENHFIGDRFDKTYVFAGLTHRDTKSAEKHMEIIERMIEVRGDWRPDWSNDRQDKWYLDWDYMSDVVDYNVSNKYQIQGVFYLQSLKQLEQIDEEFGSDLRVLFGMSLGGE